MLGALAGGLAVLPIDYVTERYLHDFFPLLVLAGAFGLHALLSLRRDALRRRLLVAACVALAFSVYANVAIAIVYQRVLVWGVPPEPRISFWHVRLAIDHGVQRTVYPDLLMPGKP
jgi:hypothetical protein